MSLGQNLQFLRTMNRNMTQEELAERMKVSRQTVSKWELDTMYPEVDKILELCDFFSCSVDALLRENMNLCREAYSNFRMEEVSAFQYVRYAVVSGEPEADAINHVKGWAKELQLQNPDMIGWDFPFVSQEQINVFHMHGYAAACILPSDYHNSEIQKDVVLQKTQKYAVVTIKEPFHAPFELIPNAYKTLMSYIRMNGYRQKADNEVLPCFEKEYQKEGVCFMDVYIAVEG